MFYYLVLYVYTEQPNDTEDIDFCLRRFLSSLLSLLQYNRKNKSFCIFIVPAIMDLMFPLKPHSVILKAPLFSSLSFPLPLRFRAVTAFKHVNIQCELEGRPNGALSGGDFDPRFIDRVCPILLLLLRTLLLLWALVIFHSRRLHFLFEVSVAFVLLLVLSLMDKNITFLGFFLCGFYCLFIHTLKEIFICFFIVLFLVVLLSAWFSGCCICVWCYAVGVLLYLEIEKLD